MTSHVDRQLCGWSLASFLAALAAVMPAAVTTIAQPGGDDREERSLEQAGGTLYKLDSERDVHSVPVQVIVDMDPPEAGLQSSVRVDTCTTTVHGISVYILDPLGEREFWWIGYAGGIDRGIAFGHMPSSDNAGTVTDISGTIGMPVNPGNVSWVVHSPALDPAFIGPEVQYVEGGSAAAAVIPANPAGPIFTVDITLAGAQPGDRYDFYLFDFISVWLEPVIDGGAFSTLGPDQTFDSGGDAIPDGTQSLYGVDADTAMPVPPASFGVDYIDGPPTGGPAVIEIQAVLGDLDADGTVGADDLVTLLVSWGACPGCHADIDGNGAVDILDLLIVLAAWGSCP